MYQRSFFFLTILLVTINAPAMEIEPEKHTLTTIITNDGKQHAIEAHKLVTCQTYTNNLEVTQQSATFHVPGLTSQEWQEFEECLEQDPQEIRSKLKNKKRLRTILTAANFLGHSQLTETAMAVWSEERFNAEDEFELPLELEHGIASKTIAATRLNAKLPLWLARNMEAVSRVVDINKTIWSCCTNTNNTQTAVGASDGTITVIDSLSQESVCWPAHIREVSDVLFSPDNTQLFSIARESVIKVWDASNHFVLTRELMTDPGIDHPFAMHINPQGNLLAFEGATDMCLWDLNADTVSSLPHAATHPQGVAFNTTGSLLATGNSQASVELWNVATRELIATLPIAGNKAARLRFNNDSTQLAVGGRNGIIYVWNLITHTLLTTIPAHTDRVWGLEFSPCNRFLFSCSADKKVKIHDLETYKCIKQIKFKGQVNDMRLTTDLELVTGSGDRKVRFVPIKKFLDLYQERKRYFERDINLPQAQLIEQAFAADEDQLLDVSFGKNAETFKQFPHEIGTLLIKELPIEKPSKRKKRKTNDDDDQDYIP